jgi:hypothetical protein
MERHKYEPISEERFQEIIKLQEQLLHNEISEEEYSSKVSDDDRANFRILAQIKFNQ